MKFLAGLAQRRLYFALTLGVIVLDQMTKILVDTSMARRATIEIIPNCFSLWYSRNAGGLFGSFRDLADPWRIVLLTVLPVIAVALIAAYLAQMQSPDRPTLLGLALILGGAVGNLIDRVFRGEVVDFLDVYVAPSRLADWLISVFGTAHWPTFNFADASIVTGACLLLLSVFRPGERAEPGDAGVSPATSAGDPL